MSRTASTPTPATPSPPEPQGPPPAQAAFERAIAPRCPLFAFVDGARESAGLYEAKQAGVASCSLFEGRMGERIDPVAPHLFDFPVRSAFRRWWFAQWGNSIGILVEANVDMDALRGHFRRLTIVRDDKRKKYFFRFYDPRVLRVFLPACTPEELDQFFGPILAFHCESDGGKELLTFTRAGRELKTQRRPVGGSGEKAEPARTPR